MTGEASLRSHICKRKPSLETKGVEFENVYDADREKDTIELIYRKQKLLL